MSDFQRYAVYYLPENAELADFGAMWLGWDVAQGVAVEQPGVEGIEAATRTPRKYGFHGTLKPPFRLADGADVAGLQADIAALAAETPPVEIAGLKLSRIGRFLALVPVGEAAGLARLAFACVTRLDRYRRPPSVEELERRRATGLTQRQDALLLKWGYPYVAEEFRFHLTLTGPLDDGRSDGLQAAAARLLPDLPRPFPISSIALAGEGTDGRFREIHRYTLTG